MGGYFWQVNETKKTKLIDFFASAGKILLSIGLPCFFGTLVWLFLAANNYSIAFLVVFGAIIFIGIISLTLREYFQQISKDPLELDSLEQEFRLEKERFIRYVYLFRTFKYISLIFPLIALIAFIFTTRFDLLASTIGTTTHCSVLSKVNCAHVSPLITIFNFQALKYVALLILFGIFSYLVTETFPTEIVYKKSKELELEIKLVNNELSSGNDNERAELQLRYHQTVLMKYYEQNIEQTGRIFKYGILFIILGIAILFITLVFVFSIISNNQNSGSASTIGLIGTISGLFVNLIGGTFIIMYKTSMELTRNLHKEFVDTNDIYLANYFNTKIKDKNKRDDSLKDMTDKLTGGKN